MLDEMEVRSFEEGPIAGYSIACNHFVMKLQLKEDVMRLERKDDALRYPQAYYHGTIIADNDEDVLPCSCFEEDALPSSCLTRM